MSANPFKSDIEKLCKVILSCTSKEQLVCAYKMGDLFRKKHKAIFSYKLGYDAGYCEGLINGLFMAKIKELKLG